MALKKRHHLAIYIAMLVLAGGALWFAFVSAADRFGVQWSGGNPQVPNNFSFEHITGNLKGATSVLFLQILAILFLAQVISRIFRRIGQPEVIGEMIAGIMLGPSLFGLLLPDAYAFLFPPSSLPTLQGLSQLGLMVFLFLIGMEVDFVQLKKHVQSAVLVSHASILMPFVLGVFLAITLFQEFAPANVTFLPFGLFMGIAMSITAFPVLARIVQERGLLHTNSGRMAITVAAVDDATAWCLLALVVALVKATGVGAAAATVLLSMAFVLTMVYVIRPLLSRMGQVYFTREIVGRGVMAFVILLILGSAIVTEMIGIHAFFGAFMAGVIFPSDSRFRRIIADKLEDFAGAVLLPLFFAFTGVRTDLGLIFHGGSGGVFVMVMIVALAGKLGGGMIAARISGMTLRDSLELGILVNTRGLVELIVLNVGYDLGVLSRELFAVMVLMALTTTFMTGPMLSLVRDTRSAVDNAGVALRRGILFAFGPVLTGLSLFRLAAVLARKGDPIQALHLYPASELIPRSDAVDGGQIFQPIRTRAAEAGIELKAVEAVSSDIAQDIASFARAVMPEILLLGAARSVFSRNRIGGKVGEILKEVEVPVGIYVEKDLPKEFKSAAVLFSRVKDVFLFALAERLRNAGVDVTVIVANEDLMEFLVKQPTVLPMRLDNDVYGEYDLMLVSVQNWLEKRYSDAEWMEDPPCSLLLMRE
ncbi:MAG: cation:proton antiporter [Leptospirales bacterium]|nr:cation:proton antiporter [Leptospirales bacterium]